VRAAPQRSEKAYLHLGCGLTTPDGWVNVDGSWQVELARRPRLKRFLVAARLLPSSQAAIPWNRDVFRLNLKRPLPFANGRFTAVFSSHTLEHLHFEEALALLVECRRVLGTGGICRAVVPDLERIVERYVASKRAGDDRAANRMMEELLVHEKGVTGGMLAAFHRLTAFHQHKWMYDGDSLRRLFIAAGFSEVRQLAHLESRIDRIHEVEMPGRILDGEGVAVEGVKP
jgi:predicted SAM-dependent methyltransferase